MSRVGRNTVVLLAAIGGGAVSVGLFAVVFNLYVLAAGRTQAELGLVLSLTTLGAAIAVLPAGAAGDAWGRRPALIAGGLVAAVATFAQCSVTSLPALLLFGVVSGATGAALAVAAVPALVESAPPGGAATLLSIAGAVGIAGTTAGSALAGWLPGHIGALVTAVLGHAPDLLERYRLTLYLGLASAGVAVLPLLVWYRDAHRPVGVRESIASFRSGVGIGGVGAPYLLANVLLGLGAGFVIPYLNVYLTRDRAIPLQTYGVIAAAGSLVLACVTALAPLVARRVGMPATVALGQLLSLPALAAMALARSTPLLAVAYCARLGLMDGNAPAAQGWVTERLPAAQRGVYSGLVLVAFQVPWSVTSALGGWLAGRIGYDPLFALTALFYVPAALVFWLGYRNLRGRFPEAPRV